jgi:hypothetical protein
MAMKTESGNDEGDLTATETSAALVPQQLLDTPVQHHTYTKRTLQLSWLPTVIILRRYYECSTFNDFHLNYVGARGGVVGSGSTLQVGRSRVRFLMRS